MKKTTQDYRTVRRSSNHSELETKGKRQKSDFGLHQTSIIKEKPKKNRGERIPKVRMMSINNTNHLISGKNSGSLVTEIFGSGKKKNAGSKIQQYKHYAAMNINDCNDVLSTTTDKRTTDDRIESYRTINNRTFKNTETHREIQERKAIQQIEETLEREYKFYQVKTTSKDLSQEKVPELLLREAADETVRKLSKMAPNYASVLFRIRD